MELHLLKATITEANEKYRTGNAIMTDAEYDKLVDELHSMAPDDVFFDQVGYISNDDTRKDKLPIEMRSMNKLKIIEEVVKWLVVKMTVLKIDINTVSLCLTPKYDGAAFTEDEESKQGWTRGDGDYGQKSDGHIAIITGETKKLPIYSFGEIIMKDQVFEENYSQESIGDHKKFSNPRNMVSGKLNDDKLDDKEVYGALKNCHYVRYGFVSKDGKSYSKSQQIDELNNNLNDIKVPYMIVTLDKITAEFMLNQFNEWRKEFAIDGIVIDINDADICEKLGRETNGNPAYARAYKSASFESKKETVAIGITWQVSKKGLLKPVVQVEPINLGGVTVSNVTGNNAKHIKNFAINVGSKITLIRSGQVIPKIIQVEDVKIPFTSSEKTAKEFEKEYNAAVKLRSGLSFNLPTNCPCCNSEVEWDETEIELVCLNADCKDQQLGRIVAFFEILEVDNVNEGVVSQLFESGFDTIEKILKMSQKDMENIDRFGERKAEIVYNSIHSKMKNVSLSKIQHASSFFRTLGSKKLKLLEKFTQTPTFDEIMLVDGFAEKSAKAYLAGLDRYNKFVSVLPVNIVKEQPKVASSSECATMNVTFTGIRRKDLEDIIQERGGVIGDSVSKNTTHLIMKSKNSGSSKEQKAEKLGITIWEVKELENFLQTK